MSMINDMVKVIMYLCANPHMKDEVSIFAINTAGNELFSVDLDHGYPVITYLTREGMYKSKYIYNTTAPSRRLEDHSAFMALLSIQMSVPAKIDYWEAKVNGLPTMQFSQTKEVYHV